MEMPIYPGDLVKYDGEMDLDGSTEQVLLGDTGMVVLVEFNPPAITVQWDHDGSVRKHSPSELESAEDIHH